jgi:hypothetical protein
MPVCRKTATFILLILAIGDISGNGTQPSPERSSAGNFAINLPGTSELE